MAPMLNFHYAAYSYLDEYLSVDKSCIDAFESEVSPEATCMALSKMARTYNINRNLAIKDEASRFVTVRVLLMQAPRPVTDEEMIKLVGEFSIKLGNAYPRKSGMKPTLLSAASKFLWMRFQAPVVMYDRYAWQWILEISNLSDTSSYADYVQVWRTFCTIICLQMLTISARSCNF